MTTEAEDWGKRKLRLLAIQDAALAVMHEVNVRTARGQQITEAESALGRAIFAEECASHAQLRRKAFVSAADKAGEAMALALDALRNMKEATTT